MMRVYSGQEIEEIMRRQADVLRERRNMACLGYSFVGFMVAVAIGCAAYSMGWRP